VNRQGISKNKAFTLIELLVVLAVIGSMIGLFGFTFFSGGNVLDSAQREVLTWIHHARSISVSEGKETRLIVKSDPGNFDHYYRYLEIVSEGNQSGYWIIKKEGELITEGTRLLPDDIDAEDFMTFSNDWFVNSFSKWSGDFFTLGDIETGESNSKAVSHRMESSENKFNFISFDSSGRVINRPRVVLSSAKIIPSQDGKLVLSFEDKLNVKGIMIQPYGGIVSLDYTDFYDQ
jgi:prepilin-type N-terminal cleavage/methylation domain-containing protein